MPRGVCAVVVLPMAFRLEAAEWQKGNRVAEDGTVAFGSRVWCKVLSCLLCLFDKSKFLEAMASVLFTGFIIYCKGRPGVIVQARQA